MSALNDQLREKVKRINDNSSKKAQIARWIDGHKGKVIGFRSPMESYHIAFTKEKAVIREGDYPSCEASYRGSEDDIVKILAGEESTVSLLKAGRVKIWGSLSEAIIFEMISIR